MFSFLCPGACFLVVYPRTAACKKSTSKSRVKSVVSQTYSEKLTVTLYIPACDLVSFRCKNNVLLNTDWVLKDEQTVGNRSNSD